MSRTAVKLDEEENLYFHMNYTYMWKKLNTAPYYVSGTGELPKWIHAQWLLPSYANLSRCLSLSYVPSMNLVNKIVQFYNANIQPEVDAFIFLHEKLEDSDSVRVAGAAADSEPFCGLYHAYYYAGVADKKTLYGAVMKIQRVHDTTSVQLVTGITTDADLDSLQLKELFSGRDISIEQYTAFRDHLELPKRRTALYKGNLEVTPGVMTLQMNSEDREGSIMVLRLPIAEGVDGRYLGSVGLLTLIAEHELQILKMGIVRADMKELKCFSLEEEQVRQILSIEKMQNEHIRLSFSDNALWNDMIISAAQ